MADIGQMVVKIVGDTTQFNTSIDQSQKKMTGFGQVAAAIGVGLTVAVTAPLIMMAKAAIQSSANMEMLGASFTTMLGSAEKSKKLMNDLIVMAAKTPFETGDLANAAKTLLQFGISAKNILPTLQMLGDASGGNSAKMGSMALVFGQISSLGRLMGQDLVQLISAGFNPLTEISQKTGESMAKLKERMSKGGISADEVTEAFKRATSAGGRFFGGMENASRTFTGLMSTLNDDTGALGRSMVEDLMPILKDIIKGFSALAKTFTGMNPEIKAFILGFLGVAAAAGPVIGLVGGLSIALTALGVAGGPIFLVAGALAVLAGIMAGIGLQMSKTAQDAKDMEKVLSGGTSGDLARDADLALTAYNKLLQVAIDMKKENVAMTEDGAIRYKKDLANLKKISEERQAILVNSKLQGKFDEYTVAQTLAQVAAQKELDRIKTKNAAADALVAKLVEDQKSEYQKILDQINLIMSQEGKKSQQELAQVELLKLKLLELDEAKKKMMRDAEEEYDAEQARARADLVLLTQERMQAEQNVAEAREKASKQSQDNEDARFAASVTKMLSESKSLDVAILQAKREYLDAVAQAEAESQAFVMAGLSSLAGVASGIFNIIDGGVENSLRGVLGVAKSILAMLPGIAGVAAQLALTVIDGLIAMIQKKSKAAKDLQLKALLSSYDALDKAADAKYNAEIKRIRNETESKINAIDDILETELTTNGLIDNDAARSAAEALTIAQRKHDGIKTLEETQLKTLEDNHAATLKLLQAEQDAEMEILRKKHAEENRLLDIKQAKEMDALDISEQALLYSLGLTGPATVEQYQKEIALAIAAGDTKAQAELEKALKILRINIDYDNQRAALAEKQRLETIALQEAQDAIMEGIEQGHADEMLKIVSDYEKTVDALRNDYALAEADRIYKETIAVQKAEKEKQRAYEWTAILRSKANKENTQSINLMIKAYNALYGMNEPLIPVSTAMAPNQKLAEGGIAMPKPGGIMANIAEAGQPEVIFPLDKLEQFLSGRAISGGDGNINLVVNLDSKPFLEKIFPATKNRTILISAGAVV